VEAEILERFGKGEGLVRIVGRTLRGLFPDSLPEGARLSLRVTSAGPPLRLQLPGSREDGVFHLLRPPADGLKAAVRLLLEAPAPGLRDGSGTAEILAAARRILGLPQDPDSLPQALAHWLRRSGLFHEALLARGEEPEDLKALALKLLARSPGAELARAARALLGHLEAYQARSLLEGAHIVPLVLPWGEEWVHGELHLEEGSGEDSSERKGFGRLRMRLEMPHLGSVEVRLRWGRGGVAVRLALEPRFIEPARSRLGELGEALASAPGIAVTELRAEPLPPPEPSSGSALVEVLA
jgi:hypothetical protein